MPCDLELVLLCRVSEASKSGHHGLERLFVVLEQGVELSILVLDSMVLENERGIQSFELRLELLCRISALRCSDRTLRDVDVESTEGEA